MVASIHGSSMLSMRLGSGMSAGLCSSMTLPPLVARADRTVPSSRRGRRLLRLELHLVDHRRRGGDEVEVIFAGQPLLDDLEVEQAEEAAAEAEAERGAGLHLEAEAGVVEAQLVEAVAELLEVGGVDREQAAEDHRLDFLEAGQRFAAGRLASVMVSPTRVSATSLICAVMKPISPAAELGQHFDLGAHAADAVDQVLVPAAMNLICWPLRITPSMTRTRMTTPR
jgi:hypothetical protein